MNISNIKNNIYRNISYKDFIKNDKGDLVLKDSSVLRPMKSLDNNLYSSYGVR